MYCRQTAVILCVAAIVALAAGPSAGAPPPASGDMPQKLLKLRQERRDTLRRALEIITKQFETGSAPYEELLARTDQLCDAELDLAVDRSQRIAVREKKLANLRAGEALLGQRLAAGRITEPVLLTAKAARLKAEIDLLVERAAQP